jgi:hypothetical protein
MLKLTSLVLGLLTVIAIAPASQAMTTNNSHVSLQTPAGNLHSQVILKIGGQPEYRHRDNADRRRELEREREAARRRHHYRGHREDRGHDRGEYHRDR